jgi:hypothetical protein
VTCRTIKRTFLPPMHELDRVNYRGLKADALDVFEPQLPKAAKEQAYNPATVPLGEFREIARDEYGVLKEINFVGQEHFTKLMQRPGRKVLGFLAPRETRRAVTR